MDTRYVINALRGDSDLSDLPVAERLAFAHGIVAVETVTREAEPVEVAPKAFLVPPRIERFYRGAAL